MKSHGVLGMKINEEDSQFFGVIKAPFVLFVHGVNSIVYKHPAEKEKRNKINILLDCG